VNAQLRGRAGRLSLRGTPLAIAEWRVLQTELL
jgi:hypothetical protein